MKHYFLNQHSHDCVDIETDKDDWFSSWGSCQHSMCKASPNHFLFLLDNEFHLVSYFGCLAKYSDLDFRESLLRNYPTSKKIDYKFERSYHVTDKMKAFRLRGKQLDTTLDEVVYIYHDNAGRSYGITRTVDASEILSDEILKDLEKTKGYLTKNGYDFLIREAERLAEENCYTFDEVETIKTTEHLIKLITQKTKQS